MEGKVKYLISVLATSYSQDSNNALNSVKFMNVIQYKLRFLFSFFKRNDREEVTYCLQKVMLL